MAGKRKSEDNKSTNPNTQRVQKRRKQMTDHEIQVDNAKRADAGAVVYAAKKLKATDAWINGTQDERNKMIRDSKDAVFHKRIQDGVHHTVIEQRLGIGPGGGVYTQWDDGNPAWEDEENDEEEGNVEEDWDAAEIAAQKAKGEERVAISKIKYNTLGFKIWRRKWASAYKSTVNLMKKINSDEHFLQNLPPAIDPKDGKFYDHIPPHLFFSTMEMAVWRNFTTWSIDGEEEITLPGPAEWYPDGYDSEKQGFFLMENIAGAFRAWEMLREEIEPADFAWVLPGNEALMVLPQSAESEQLLEILYSM